MDLYRSHHVLAVLAGGAKEYVVFPADRPTRERLLFNDVSTKFESMDDAPAESSGVWSANAMAALGVETGWRVAVQPGELLYIPAGCPHALRHVSAHAIRR